MGVRKKRADGLRTRRKRRGIKRRKSMETINEIPDFEGCDPPADSNPAFQGFSYVFVVLDRFLFLLMWIADEMFDDLWRIEVHRFRLLIQFV